MSYADRQDAAMPPYERNPVVLVTKFLISGAFYAARETGWAVLGFLGRKRPPSAVGIYYHNVPAQHRGRFVRQMEHLLRWAEPVRADRTEPLPAGRRFVMVTMDDGWASFVENALPELRKRNIPVAIFLVAGRLGSNLGEPNDHILTEEELRGLIPDIESGLVMIGSHTSSHARITEIDPGEAWSELVGSRALLERTLGKDVNLFCFPFSSESPELVELCRKAGYKRVFGGRPAPALKDPGEFLIGRVRVDPSDWLPDFHLKLMGAYDWVPYAASLKRRVIGIFKSKRPSITVPVETSAGADEIAAELDSIPPPKIAASK
jgi:peptidoglycan/xylan/chitin deacetylase (PgdA/CDA1 family)